MNDSKNLRLQSVVLPVLALAGASAFFYYAAPILIPVVMAISLAYTISPLVSFMDRFKIPHSLSVMILLLLVVILAVVIGYFLVLQLNDLAGKLPQYSQDLIRLAEGFKAKLSHLPGGLFSEQMENLDPSRIDPKYFAQAGKYLLKGLSSAVSLVFGSFLIFFLTYFILNDQKNLQRRLTQVFGQTQEGAAVKIISEINGQIKAFIQVKFWTTIALSIIFTAGLLIMGVSYAYIWGPLAGILNLVPFVGSVIGAVPPVIVALIESDSIILPLVVIAFFTVIQLLESNLISPKIIGDKVNLSPLAVLIASMYWGWLWGGLGVILAVPITAALKVICDHIESLRPIGLLLAGRKD